jgi:hypothetical protein
MSFFYTSRPLNTLALHAPKAKLHSKKFYDDCLRHRPEIFSSRQRLRNKTRPAEFGFRTSSKIRCWGSGRLPERKSLKIKIEKTHTNDNETVFTSAKFMAKSTDFIGGRWQEIPFLGSLADGPNEQNQSVAVPPKYARPVQLYQFTSVLSL